MISLRTSACVLALLAALAACGAPESVKLGFISGQTGPFSDLGTAGLNGAIMAVEQRNAAGGVEGRPVKLIIRDDEHNTAKAQAAFEELVKEDVAAIIGPMTSSMAVSLVPLANRHRIVLMGGTVVTNSLSDLDDFFLRAISPTPHYASHTAAFHIQHVHPRRIAVIFDAANRDYAENWAMDYVTALQKTGDIHTNLIEIDSRTPQDMAVASETLLKTPPDLITCVCSARTTARMMQMIRAHNSTIRFAASAWAANQFVLENAGKAAEGALVEQYHDLSDPSPNYRAFVDAYQQRFRIAPDYAAVIAYDATSIVLDGLSLNTDRASLKDTLLKKRHFKGLQVPIDLNPQGDATRPVFYTVVKNGQFAPIH
ncbi:MAG: ABC transporter substrate-binding protein [Zoogloeaceae bacterium]|nr:ABC transporter substrate-binding protein [Zoogloeaceae bacterium]